MQAAGDSTVFKRKVTVESIDVHPTETAIVVTYEVKATLYGELGDPLQGDRKDCQKIIRLKCFNEKTPIPTLAKEIVTKCELLRSTKQSDIEQLLYYLQKRQKDKKDDPSLHLQPGSSEEPDISPVDSETASIGDVDNYVELMYEDLPDRIRGSYLILKLAKSPENLDILAKNNILVGALARVLREDYKRSIDLSTNIIYTFFCFSTYTQFHSVIATNKIGSLCMDVIEFEMRRQEQWKEDLEKKKRHSNGPSEEHQEGDYEKSMGKYNNLIKKQDRLLRVGFYMLLNIAEDVRMEEKMRRKNLIPLLIKAMERENNELLMVAVTFLKKLSIFVENKDDMAELNVIEKVPRLLNTSCGNLTNVVIRLLFNLSFDSVLRSKMVKVGLLPKLVSCMPVEYNTSPVVGLLYHLSMNDKCKSMFTYTDCIPLMMPMVLKCEAEQVDSDIMSLCINLAANKRNAQLICEGTGLKMLLKRAFDFQDQLVMKMVRNISQHEGPTKSMFVEFIGDIADAIQQAEDEDFILECVGTLGNLTIPDLDYEQLFRSYNMIPWILSRIIPGSCEDDLMLEVVVLLGTVCADEGCAMLICKADVLVNLIELLKARQEDDEIVLQILYIFYQLCQHDSTRGYLINETDAPGYLIDLLQDKNSQIQRVCDHTLDVIAEHSSQWANRLQAERFRTHNAQWLDMVEAQAFDDNADEDDDLEGLSSFADEPNILDRSELLYQAESLNFTDDLVPNFAVDGAGSLRSRSSSAVSTHRFSISNFPK